MNKWTAYIDKTVNKLHNELHIQSKLLWYKRNASKLRALSLGPGAGNEEVDLLNMGWEVTGVDISSHSNTVIQSRIKKKNKFLFQNKTFSNMMLVKKYNYALAYNSIPFSKKKDFDKLLDYIAKHMKKNGVFAFNMFGSTHDFVKSKICFGMTEKSVSEKLKSQFSIKYMYRKRYKMRDGTQWDAIDIIVTKK